MILTTIAALSMLRTMENINHLAPPSIQAGPVGKEISAVKELQGRVGKLMWNDHARGSSTMLRWLRARKMNVDAAEKMILEHLKWRKKYDIDKRRNDPPDPKMYDRFWYNMTGFSRNGSPVMIFPFGEWDLLDYIDSGGTRENFDRHQGHMWEQPLVSVEKVEIKTKKPIQYIMINDMAKLKYRQMASITSVQYILSIANNFENNYPEVVYYAYLINSDWVFDILLRIIRPVMQGAVEKLKLLGTDRTKWEKVIRKQIDPAILPYRYGGYSDAERKQRNLPPLPKCKYC